MAVSRLKGQVRLSFSRRPYSHWSVAFSSPPKLDVDVTSRVQGRSFSHVTSLVSAQVGSCRKLNMSISSISHSQNSFHFRFTNGFSENTLYPQVGCAIDRFSRIPITSFCRPPARPPASWRPFGGGRWKSPSWTFLVWILCSKETASTALWR